MKVNYSIVCLKEVPEDVDISIMGCVRGDKEWEEQRHDAVAVKTIDGKIVEIVGTDGYEPEDKCLFRDFRWVASALKVAYDEGFENGKATASSR